MVKYSLGLTAVTMIALSGLYIAGCNAAGSGMGILDPYETSSPIHGHGGSGTPTPSPSVSPTRQVSTLKIFQDKLTNPLCLIPMSTWSNGPKEYGQQSNYWTLQYDLNGGADTALVRIAADTEESKSKTDTKSPHRMQLIDAETGEPIILNDAVSMVRVAAPSIKEYERKSEKVFSADYNPTNSFLVIADNIKSAESGRIIIVNPNEEQNKDDLLYAKVLYSSAKHPVSIAADGQYIWWAECKVDAAVMRMDYTSPDKIGQDAWRVKTYTAGLQYPEFIMSSGNNVYIADTGGNCVFIGPRIIEEKEQEKSEAQVCEYATNDQDGYYKLENVGFNQPYALALLNNGKLLIADGSANPMFDSGDAPQPLNGNMGRLFVWDFKTQNRQPNEKLGLEVKMLCEGINNPMMIAASYDASLDYTSKNAQYADLIIPQYNPANNNSNLAIVRADVTYHKSKMVKSANFLTTDRTTFVYLLTRINSTDAAPMQLPEDSKTNIQVIFNEKLKDQTYNSVLQYFNDDYPL